MCNGDSNKIRTKDMKDEHIPEAYDRNCNKKVLKYIWKR